MDKMTFASYKFKPSDVIEGLNRYFAETKANRYRRVPLEIRNGVWTSNPNYKKDIIFTNSPPDRHTRSGRVCWAYYLICDPEEVVGVAINWLREKHDIFYTPGMETPVEDFDVDESFKEYEKATRKDIFCEEKLDMVSVAKVREALGVDGDTDMDIFEDIARRDRIMQRQTERIEEQRIKIKDLEEELERTKKSDKRAHSEMYKARGEKYEIAKLVREIRKAAGMDDSDPRDLVRFIEKLRADKQEGNDDYLREHATRLLLEDKVDRLELARDNYKEIAKENKVQWNNTNVQLQWAQEENRKWLEKYEKLKSELDDMTKRYGESVITSGGICEDLSKEREKVQRMEKKLIEIQDICES